MLALAVFALSVQAIGPAGVEWLRETNYDTAAAGASGQDTTEGGNITVLNITSANSSTERWAGYLGNISTVNSNIVLANPTLDIFYSWDWDAANDGEICAGTATTYVWADLAAGAAADVDTVWVFGDVSDDAEATFDDGNANIDIAGSVIAAPSADTGQANGFVTMLLTDQAAPAAEGDFLFCTNTSIGAGTGYDGSTVDYELIVPTTYGATEDYYFFVELA